MKAAYDWTRWLVQRNAHHKRYVRRIEAMPRKLCCQECGGAGGHVEPVLDYGEGPWESCGWCEGTGYVLPFTRSLWLRCRKAEAKKPSRAREK